MKLSDYLAERNETQSAFAQRAGITQRTVSRVVHGDGCNADTAYHIIRASRSEPSPSGGTVTLADLVLGEAPAA